MNRVLGCQRPGYEFEATRLGIVDKNHMGKLCRPGRLDQQIATALPKLSVVRFKQLTSLTNAVAANFHAVLAEADRLAGLKSTLLAVQVVDLLVAAGSEGGVGRSDPLPADMPLSCDGQTLGRIKVARNGAVNIELDAPIVRTVREQLMQAVEAFVRRRVIQATPAARTSAEVQS